MPYIKQELRDKLDPALTPLIAKIKEICGGDVDMLPGLMAYCLMKIMVYTCAARYAMLAKVVGAVETTKHEFMRRHVDDYEQDKMETNGDV